MQSWGDDDCVAVNMNVSCSPWLARTSERATASCAPPRRGVSLDARGDTATFTHRHKARPLVNLIGREKERIKKGENNSHLAAAAVMVPLSVLGGWGVVEPAASPKTSEKGWRERKKYDYLFISLWKHPQCLAPESGEILWLPLLLLFPPSSYTGALRHSLECRVEEVEVVAVRWWEIRTFNASFSLRSLVSSSQSRP